MTPSDDLSPPRRPMFFPVVIATVFLTIIGMTAGFVLGERHRDRARATPTTPTDNPVTAPPPGADSRPLCPEETRRTAAEVQLPTDLYQILKIVTDQGTTVWICEDPRGGLYYQGKTGGVDAPLVERENGLFLSKVARLADADEFEAFAGNGNRIVVTRERLEVQFADGRPRQVDKVVEAE